MSTPWICKPKRDILQRVRHTCAEPGCGHRVGSVGSYCPIHRYTCTDCGKRIQRRRDGGAPRCKNCSMKFRFGKSDIVRDAREVIADYERAIERGWEPEFCMARIKAIREQYID